MARPHQLRRELQDGRRAYAVYGQAHLVARAALARHAPDMDHPDRPARVRPACATPSGPHSAPRALARHRGRPEPPAKPARGAPVRVERQDARWPRSPIFRLSLPERHFGRCVACALDGGFVFLARYARRSLAGPFSPQRLSWAWADRRLSHRARLRNSRRRSRLSRASCTPTCACRATWPSSRRSCARRASASKRPSCRSRSGCGIRGWREYFLLV